MSESFVDSLRELSGETNLDSILKSGLGGYTKQSVQDYLAVLKKQQQGLKDAYEAELLTALKEKEIAIKDVNRELDDARYKLQFSEDERRKTIGELKGLRQEHETLETDMNEALVRINEDTETISQLKRELEEERQKMIQNQNSANESAIEEVKAESEILREKLNEEREKSRWLEKKNRELSERFAEVVGQSANLRREVAEIKEIIADFRRQSAYEEKYRKAQTSYDRRKRNEDNRYGEYQYRRFAGEDYEPETDRYRRGINEDYKYDNERFCQI